jgi:hypothetical protein
MKTWKLWSKFPFSSNPQDCAQLINDILGAAPEQKLSSSFNITFCSSQLCELYDWLITYLTPESKVLLEQSAVPYPLKKIVFYGAKMFTVIRTHHLPSLSQKNSIHMFPPYVCNMQFNIIPIPMPRFPNGLFPSGLPTKTL